MYALRAFAGALPDVRRICPGGGRAAASYVAETGDRSIAAVAAPGAAALYGLEVLSERVQLTDANRTRFYVLSRQALADEGLTRAVFLLTCEGNRLDDFIVKIRDAGLELAALHDRPEGSRLGMYRYLIEVTDETGITDDQLAACEDEDARCAGRFEAVEPAAPAKDDMR